MLLLSTFLRLIAKVDYFFELCNPLQGALLWELVLRVKLPHCLVDVVDELRSRVGNELNRVVLCQSVIATETEADQVSEVIGYTLFCRN